MICMTTAFALTRFSPVCIKGIQDWTVGVSKAPRTDSKSRSMQITARLLLSLINKAAKSTPRLARKSSPAIMFRLFPRSARIPPRGENNTAGTIDAARNPAYAAADPVFSRTYIDMAKSRIPFPKRELACPAMRREKFL